MRDLGGHKSGLEFIELVLRYLGSAADIQKDDLQRAAAQALPDGERLMATPAEQWIQEGLEQGLARGERQVLMRLIRHRFGEAVARESEGRLAGIGTARLEDLCEVLLECADGEEWLARLSGSGPGA
jgi:hypothetical protein